MQYPDSALKRILFIDIETAAQSANFDDLSESAKQLWSKKANQLTKIEELPLSEEQVANFYADRAAIYAEYARVVCIAVGFISEEEENKSLRIKVIYEDNEKDTLMAFADLLALHYHNKAFHYLCGHNIKEFDIPFLCRRYLINHLALPDLLSITGHKPWQVHHLLDTMEMWKFGDYKYYTSLDTLCMALQVPSPKSLMDGAKVNHSYWSGGVADIIAYAKDDIIATTQVYLSLINKELIPAENIVVI